MIRRHVIQAIFRREYLNLEAPHRYLGHRQQVDPAGGAVDLLVEIESGAVRRWRAGRGADIVEAALAVAVDVLGVELSVLDHQRQALNHGAASVGQASASVVAYVELRGQQGAGAGAGAPVHGAGLAADGDTATVRAVLGAMNRVAAAAAAGRRPRAAAML